jgi:hypothetical protein
MTTQRVWKMGTPRQWKLGTHVLRFEPPNTLWVNIQGPATFEDNVQLMDAYREQARQQPFFLVLDMEGATTTDEEGLRYVSEHLETTWFLGVIYIKARLIQKAAVKSITYLQYLSGHVPRDEVKHVYYVDTEEEARDLLSRLYAQSPPES